VNPGLKIRISQGVTDILQQNLILYGMTYLDLTLGLGEGGSWFLRVWPINFELRYFNVIQEPVQIDFSTFLFKFTESPFFTDESVIMMAAPLI
jgi:hypothetical protein